MFHDYLSGQHKHQVTVGPKGVLEEQEKWSTDGKMELY